MPWFEGKPDFGIMSFWGYVPQIARPPVGRHPHPNSVRALNAQFRMRYTRASNFANAVASRWLVFFQLGQLPIPPNPEDVGGWGWLDLAPTPDVDVLEGSTGVSLDGWEVQLRLEGTNNLPVAGGRGIISETKLISPSDGTFEVLREHSELAPNGFDHRMVLSNFGATTTTVPPGWPWAVTENFNISVADCFSFPGGPPEVPAADFMRFNGLDSYVSLSRQFNAGPNMRAIVEVFARDDRWVFPIRDSGGYDNRWGYDAGIFRWRNGVFPSSQALPLNQWVELEARREWLPGDPGGLYRFFMDGIEVAGVGAPGLGFFANRLGADPVHSAGEWGDFDMRNYRHWTGSLAAPIETIEFPLLTDACDIGPTAIKGTVVNWTLPSCP